MQKKPLLLSRLTIKIRLQVLAHLNAILLLLKCLNPESVATDFNRPGHIFPLIAKNGGVLRRAGHTEAAIDFARLSGR